MSDEIKVSGQAKDGTVFDENSELVKVQKLVDVNITLEAAIGNAVMVHDQEVAAAEAAAAAEPKAE